MVVIWGLLALVWLLAGWFGWLFWWRRFTVDEVFEHRADIVGEWLMLFVMSWFGPVSFVMGWMLFGRKTK